MRNSVPTSPRPYAIYKAHELVSAKRDALHKEREAARPAIQAKIEDQLGLTPLLRKYRKQLDRVVLAEKELKAAGVAVPSYDSMVGTKVSEFYCTKRDRLVDAELAKHPASKKLNTLEPLLSGFMDTAILAGRTELKDALASLERALR
jgi:hypothetical protein